MFVLKLIFVLKLSGFGDESGKGDSRIEEDEEGECESGVFPADDGVLEEGRWIWDGGRGIGMPVAWGIGTPAVWGIGTPAVWGMDTACGT